MARSLVIVESPAKARTLAKYLGRGYEVKASVGHIVDLPAIQVRPDAALQAELLANAPRVDHIVTLETVQVRPDRATLAQLDPLAAVRERVVDLATVYVRPTAEQLAERTAIVAREQAEALVAQVGSQLASSLAAQVRSVQP